MSACRNNGLVLLAAAATALVSARNTQYVERPTTSPLLHFPAELRNLIYHHALSDVVVQPRCHWDGGKLVARIESREKLRAQLEPFALSHTCRQIRAETFLLPFALNTFAFTDIKLFHRWTTALDVRQRAGITSISVLPGLCFEVMVIEAELDERYTNHDLIDISEEMWEEKIKLKDMFTDLLAQLEGLGRIAVIIHVDLTMAEHERVLNKEAGSVNKVLSDELWRAELEGYDASEWRKNLVLGRDINIVTEEFYVHEVDGI